MSRNIQLIFLALALTFSTTTSSVGGDGLLILYRRACLWGKSGQRRSAFIVPVQLKQKHYPHDTSRHFVMENDPDNDHQQINSSNDKLVRRTRDEWIGGQEMMQIMASEERKKSTLEAQQSQLPTLNISERELKETYLKTLKSRISYTDAKTLEIRLPAAGISGNSAVTGAFAALWFSAIAPATVSMLSAGLAPALFMSPFWIAGAVIAKTAVYDPFVSSKLTIGQYLWTLEFKYLKRSKTKEGPTQSLKGAVVDVAMIVNNVPMYELQLFTVDEKIGSFAKGFDVIELEHLRDVINDYLDGINSASVIETPHS